MKENKAKEKAKEIYSKYKSYLPSSLRPDLSKALAKKCALICVEEIISAYPTTVESFYNLKGLNVVHLDNRNFWNEVKEEINKL